MTSTLTTLHEWVRGLGWAEREVWVGCGKGRGSNGDGWVDGRLMFTASVATVTGKSSPDPDPKKHSSL